MRRVALFAMLLSVPLASAAEEARVESPFPPRVTGAFGVTAPEGFAWNFQVEATGAFGLRNVTGVAELLTWTAYGVDVNGDITWTSVDEGTTRTIPLEEATIQGILANEEFKIVVRAAGGTLGVAGDAPAAPVVQSWLTTDWTPGVDRVAGLSAPTLPGEPRQLPVRARAGWGAIGDVAAAAHEPRPTEPRLWGRGALEFEIEGGNLSISQAGGTEEIRLSAESSTDAGLAHVYRAYRLFIKGDVAQLDAPLADAWILASAAPVWSVDGAALWKNATVEDAEGRREGPVRVEGVFELAPQPPGVAPIGPEAYDLRGDYRIWVEGQERSAESRAMPAAGWTAAAALAALLAWFGSPFVAGRFIAPFYTRIARGEMLTHPVRARICEIIADCPGIHLRELQRRVGRGWGTITYHVGMLQQCGSVHLERDGRYFVAYLAHQELRATGPRTIVASRVLAAVPSDGRPVTVTILQSELGLSRQLVDHHLTTLAQRGLVVIDKSARPRTVSRSANEPQISERTPVLQN